MKHEQEWTNSPLSSNFHSFLHTLTPYFKSVATLHVSLPSPHHPFLCGLRDKVRMEGGFTTFAACENITLFCYSEAC